jgi:hypothetical protein
MQAGKVVDAPARIALAPNAAAAAVSPFHLNLDNYYERLRSKMRWLPFWIANLVERMWLALGIILAVLLPLTRVVPPLYQFRIRSRVFRWYGQLRDIENRLHDEPAQAAGLVRELDALDERVGRISVPLSYADELYALRNNIDTVRRRALQPAA